MYDVVYHAIMKKAVSVGNLWKFYIVVHSKKVFEIYLGEFPLLVLKLNFKLLTLNKTIIIMLNISD